MWHLICRPECNPKANWADYDHYCSLFRMPFSLIRQSEFTPWNWTNRLIRKLSMIIYDYNHSLFAIKTLSKSWNRPVNKFELLNQFEENPPVQLLSSFWINSSVPGDSQESLLKRFFREFPRANLSNVYRNTKFIFRFSVFLFKSDHSKTHHSGVREFAYNA